MSDTTPRPDEDPTDPTAPPPPPPAPAHDEEPSAPEAPASAAPEAPAPAAPAGPTYAGPPQQPYPPQPYPQQPPPPGYAQQPPPPGYAHQPPPQAPLTPSEERTWGMLSHVIGGGAMVLSAGFLGFVGSLVVYLMYKDRGPFVRAHAANSLNVQITAAIGFLIGWVLAIVLVGFAILAVVFVWAVVMHIIGAVKANNGEWWTPPMTPQFIK